MSENDGPIALFHRSDLDGLCSGAIVKRALPTVELLGYNYGDELDLEKLKWRDVIMVDCSLQPFEEMLKVAELASSLTWIDHHKGALEEYERCGRSFMGLQRDGEAGCELTWKYYFTNEPMPRAVYLLGRYDVFDLEADDDVIPFQYGMRGVKDTQPEAEIWDRLLSERAWSVVEDLTKRGQVCFEYQQVQDAEAVKALGFEVEFDGVKAIVCNAAGRGSMLFDSVFDPERHDVMCPFHMQKNGRWTVSLYSKEDGPDCSALAKARGGSGHMHAAGFQCDELPWRERG